VASAASRPFVAANVGEEKRMTIKSFLITVAIALVAIWLSNNVAAVKNIVG
jgi:hypothetical protein